MTYSKGYLCLIICAFFSSATQASDLSTLTKAQTAISGTAISNSKFNAPKATPHGHGARPSRPADLAATRTRLAKLFIHRYASR